MKTFIAITKRNIQLFFKDKGMFFSALITPIILLVLYTTFLGNVYHDSFVSALPEGFSISEKIINGTVGGQLCSSLLAVCCVTVAFCSNLLMVQDKTSGARKDFLVTPVKKSILSLSYYFASLITTLIISYIAVAASFIYIAFTGWFFTFGDCLLLLLDVFLVTMFGTAISSIINVFLSTNGQASAVGTIVSAGYGFICGAYMPISSFGSGLQKVLSFLPGTYGTSLIRNHYLKGVFRAMGKEGIPEEIVSSIKKSIDCNLSFFEKDVSIAGMYIILISSILILIGIYVLINLVKKGRE